MVGDKFFLVIPVYRLDEEKYYAGLRKNFEHSISEVWSEEFCQSNPGLVQGYQQHHHYSYGGAWEFNEVVGHIKLYFLGTQVRGEYWSTGPKRKVKTRRKQFEYKTHKLAVEERIREKTSAGVLAAVEEYLIGCKRELKNRHIDLREFNMLKNHLDWLSLFAETNPLHNKAMHATSA